MSKLAKRSLALFILLAATTFSVGAFAQDMPLGFDRELVEVKLPGYELQLESGETVTFKTSGVKRITIGETKVIAVEHFEDEGLFRATAGSGGTTMMRVHRADGSEVSIRVVVSGEVYDCGNGSLKLGSR